MSRSEAKSILSFSRSTKPKACKGFCGAHLRIIAPGNAALFEVNRTQCCQRHATAANRQRLATANRTQCCQRFATAATLLRNSCVAGRNNTEMGPTKSLTRLRLSRARKWKNWFCFGAGQKTNYYCLLSKLTTIL